MAGDALSSPLERQSISLLVVVVLAQRPPASDSAEWGADEDDALLVVVVVVKEGGIAKERTASVPFRAQASAGKRKRI